MTTTRNQRSRSSLTARSARRAAQSRPRAHHAPEPGELANPGALRGWTWSNGKFSEISTLDEVEDAFRRHDAYLWVDAVTPSAEMIGDIAQCIGLHPLIVEDIVERNQRAKIETELGESLHIVMFALHKNEQLEDSEVDLVLGNRFLLTVHDERWDPLKSHHFRDGVKSSLKQGPDFVLYAIVDQLVDGYFPVFDRIGDEIEDLQDRVIARPSEDVVQRLLTLRRDLLTIRHAVTPQREIFNQLTTRDMGLVKPDHLPYFRDVYDHLIRLTDELDTFRELVSSTLEAYLTIVNNNLSEVMKRLTAATVVVAGMGAIAGIFGMSESARAFDMLAYWQFWVVTAGVVAFGVLATIYFRRIGWL